MYLHLDLKLVKRSICNIKLTHTHIVSAYQVNKRHVFLEQLIGVKEEEVTSYEHMHSCLVVVTACICSFSVLEVLAYFLYLFKVKQLKLILTKDCDSNV